jgi:surfeit locus 1 family protein
LPDVPTPSGWVVVEGRVAPPPSRLMDFGEAGTGRIRQNLDVDAFAREIGLPLRPVSIQQTSPTLRQAEAGTDNAPSSGEARPVDDGLLRQWPQADLGVGKHHGYAFQWFALCALTAGLTLWFQIIRPRRTRHAHGHP